jgi:hypothetical protein
MLQQICSQDAQCELEKQAAGPTFAGPAGASRCHLHNGTKTFATVRQSDYDEQVQSQPSAQLSQQPLSQLQSGQSLQHSQQDSPLQQPPVVEAAGPVEANDMAPADSAAKAANDQRALVNMIELTFWLMK